MGRVRAGTFHHCGCFPSPGRNQVQDAARGRGLESDCERLLDPVGCNLLDATWVVLRTGNLSKNRHFHSTSLKLSHAVADAGNASHEIRHPSGSHAVRRNRKCKTRDSFNTHNSRRPKRCHRPEVKGVAQKCQHAGRRAGRRDQGWGCRWSDPCGHRSACRRGEW